MGKLCCPEVKDKVLYDLELEVARIDNDNDFAVTCNDCGYKVHIPIEYVLEMINNYYNKRDNKKMKIKK